jgi:hypothetical protein
MFPSSFDESNGYLGKPPDMTDEQCESLSVWRGNANVVDGGATPTVVSCWKLTKEELGEVNRTGRVWLWVVGVTMPPVILTAHKPMFPATEQTAP